MPLTRRQIFLGSACGLVTRAEARPVAPSDERQTLLGRLEAVMGPFPNPLRDARFRAPLDIRTERVERLAAYECRKINYQSAQGERVPAWLLMPHGARKAPAVLALHQTVAIGKDEAAGRGGNSSLQYGRELAQRGFVVLCPDYPSLGEHFLNDPQKAIYSHGWASGSMKAIWDNVRGVDLLQSLPEVDGDRIGCLGHSLGGHNSLFTAAFDPRIRAVVTNCGFTAFSKYYGGNLTGWMGERYMPRIRTHFPTPDRMPFDFDTVLAAIAPRAVLAIAPLRDSNFEVTGVREVVATAGGVYRLLGAPERLQARYPDCAHDWPTAEREAAYSWLNRWLR